MFDGEGAEIKKELSALASVKLDLPALSTRYASCQDSIDKIDGFTQKLTDLFGRHKYCHVSADLSGNCMYH